MLGFLWWKPFLSNELFVEVFGGTVNSLSLIVDGVPVLQSLESQFLDDKGITFSPSVGGVGGKLSTQDLLFYFAIVRECFLQDLRRGSRVKKYEYKIKRKELKALWRRMKIEARKDALKGEILPQDCTRGIVEIEQLPGSITER